MSNTVLWLDPDSQQKVSGNNQVIAAYLIDPTSNKAYAASGGGGGGGAVTDITASGNLTTASGAGSTVSIAFGTGQATWEAQLTGTFSSGTTIVFEGSDDNTNWFTVYGVNVSLANPAPISSISGAGPFLIRGVSSGYQNFRVRCSVLHSGDNVAVLLVGSVGASGNGGLATNDGTFARETGGNLASIKSDLDTVVTNTTGASTAANQVTGNTSLSTIATNTTGVATAANQSAGNTSLSTIATNTTGIATQTTLASILSTLQGILSTSVADVSTTGTISAAQSTEGTPVANATVVLSVGNGQSTWKAQLLAGGGGFTSGTTIVADKSVDGGATWYSATFKVAGASPATPVSSVVGPGPVEMTGDASGANRVRIRCSVLNSTETVAVTLRASAGVSDVGLISSIPAGSNLIGGVNLIDSGGTNKVAIDASGNQQIRGGFTEVAGNGTGVVNGINTDLISATDVSAYKWFSLQIAGSWSGTLTFQGSNDNVNFVSVLVQSVTGNSFITAVTSNGIFAGSIQFRYLRVRMTSFSSNTSLVGTLELYTQAPSQSNVEATQVGTWTTNTQSATSGGTADYHLISASGTNATNIKASGGQVYGYELGNNGASDAWVKLYNASSAPTAGSGTPFRTIYVPKGGRTSFHSSTGLLMGTGIGLTITGGAADADTTAVAAAQVTCEIDYK